MSAAVVVTFAIGLAAAAVIVTSSIDLAADVVLDVVVVVGAHAVVVLAIGLAAPAAAFGVVAAVVVAADAAAVVATCFLRLKPQKARILKFRQCVDANVGTRIEINKTTFKSLWANFLSSNKWS